MNAVAGKRTSFIILCEIFYAKEVKRFTFYLYTVQVCLKWKSLYTKVKLVKI